MDTSNRGGEYWVGEREQGAGAGMGHNREMPLSPHHRSAPGLLAIRAKKLVTRTTPAPAGKS